MSVAENKFSMNVAPTNKCQKNNTSPAEITVRQFLEFLRTAYQVQDTVEGTLLAQGFKEAVDWIKLKDSQLVKREAESQTSSTRIGDGSDKRNYGRRKSDTPTVVNGEDALRTKLGEVLTEGLLDSVLPYLIPANPIKKASTSNKILEKSSATSVNNSGNKDASAVRKTSIEFEQATKSTLTKDESEVEIHVCDEVKDIKKDFVCNQKLLTEKMGYFAEVTTGQRLEDMDISVHCDISIFEWLMRWVKKDCVLEEDWPQLDNYCVIPVLVSAAFLKMEPLLEECLLFCHEYMNEILRTNTNLSCLNDALVTRLAAMYTNAEVENIRDRKDKIQSRLFIKLIRSLVEPVPESVRGHWCSLARVYRCGKCQQLVAPKVAHAIPCIPSCMRLQANGSTVSNHVRDSLWNIKDYLHKLLKSLKTWRRVYWRLWGDAHFLYCTTCNKYFPAHQIGWCRYHPDSPQFFTVEAQKAPLPVGRYPCCGDRAYRFQLLDNQAGCKFREHTPCVKEVRDAAIVNMLEMYRHLVEEEPPELIFPERLTRLVARDPSATIDSKLECNEKFWWEGLQITAPRPKLGLLGAFFDSTVREELQSPHEELEEESSEENNSTSTASSCTTTNSEGSEESSPRPVKSSSARKKKPIKKYQGRFWQSNLSVRNNQDIQRSYEEAAMKKIVSVLCRRVSANTDNGKKALMTRHVTPPGGIWVRLETEWRENHINGQQPKQKSIFTGKARTKPGNNK